MPSEIGWGEALDLVRVLRGDPSSQLAAAIEGWDYPLERVGWILSDLMDVQGPQVFKKWQPYGRPIKPPEANKKRRGNAAGRTPAQVKAILADFGHAIPA